MLTRTLLAISLMAMALPAQADDMDRPGPLAVGAKVGIVLPQISTELGTTWGTELDASFRVIERVTVFGGFGYTQPRVSRTSVMDPRVGTSYDGTQTQRELTLSAGARYGFMPPESMWNAYAGLALRMYMLETVTVGDAAANDFGRNTEKSTRVGGVIVAGGQRRIGPGAALAELQLGGSSLPHLITGDVTTAAMALGLGYRLAF